MQKYKRYILAVAVILVWAVVAYKVIDIVFTEETIELPSYLQSKPLVIDTVSKDYPLLLNYNDPFLGYYYNTKEIEAVNNTAVYTPEILHWPDIGYKGSIEHNGQLKAIIEIEQITKSVKRGDVIGNLKIVSISTDSIIIKQQTEKRTFPKLL